MSASSVTAFSIIIVANVSERPLDASKANDSSSYPRFSQRNLNAVIIYCFLFVIEALGNLTVYVNLLHSRHRKSRISLMIRHLTIADLVVTFIMIPLEVGWRLAVEWLAGNFACKAFLFIRAFGLYLSSNVLVCVSLDRYFAVLHPLKVTDARRRCKLMLAWAWSISLLCAIPQTPQWESTTPTIIGTFRDFLQFTEQQQSNEEWLYFDYKYLKEWLSDVKPLSDSIKWCSLGFADKSTEDSTIWIGSRGAHTSCHIDTYGYNVVAQIFGKKLWLLFPPEENLLPTRVPYEESSIYSKINLYSPNAKVVRGLSSCRKVVLEPGQVLIVPNGWWHFVENLETAISVNMWVGLGTADDERRIDEAITRLIVKSFIHDLDDDRKRDILNPNECLNETLDDTVQLIDKCVKIYRRNRDNDNDNDNDDEHQRQIDLTNKHENNVEVVPEMECSDYLAFIQAQSQRFANQPSTTREFDDDQSAVASHMLLDTFLNALTKPNVVAEIKSNLLNVLQ